MHVGKRIPYLISKGGGVMAPVLVWEWRCSACPYVAQDSDTDEAARKRVQGLADSHTCTSLAAQ